MAAIASKRPLLKDSLREAYRLFGQPAGFVRANLSLSGSEGGIGSQICIHNDTDQLAQVYAYLILIGVIAVT